MGTRNLVAVIADGDFRVAQYGQYDGDPTGQGTTVLNFLRKPGNIDKLRAAVSGPNAKVYWLAEETEIEVTPSLSRNTGGDILDLIVNVDGKVPLADTRGFGGDSLFCEWAYVVDLDQNRLEVYKGFNKTPTPADSRFPSGADWLELSVGYEPVMLLTWLPLDNLPNEATFVDTIEAQFNDDGEVIADAWGKQFVALTEPSAA